MERYEMPGGKGWQIFPDLRKLCHDENIFVSLVFIHSLPNMCLLFPLFSSSRSKSYPLLSLSSFSTFHMIFNGPCWCSGGVPFGFGSVLCYNLNVKVIVYLLQTYMSCDVNIVTAPLHKYFWQHLHKDSFTSFNNFTIKHYSVLPNTALGDKRGVPDPKSPTASLISRHTGCFTLYFNLSWRLAFLFGL